MFWFKKILKYLAIFLLLTFFFVVLLYFKNTSAQQNVQEVVSQIKKHEPKNIGILMFRGNPARNFYGTGPISNISPEITWRYPDKPLCAISYVANVARQWCGNGWTGQPIVWARPDGITEIIVNAYDRGIHFINAETGKQTRPTFYTNDIIKGTVTLDDDYPILYSGSRDNFYRIIALDRDVPTELWKIEARKEDGVWNDDWDPNGIAVNDILYTGSENGWFHAIKLNRDYDADGKVTVNPIEVFKYPTYADGYIEMVGDDDLSIESSPLLVGNTVYIANSGGRIMGFDTSHIDQGIAPTVFDFWTGDDTDATLVADDEGYIYAVSEMDRSNNQSKEVGQIMKLDPRMYQKSSGPFVWGIHVPTKGVNEGGVWATPAIRKNRLYVATNPGDIMIIDTKDGLVLDKKFIGEHAWSSPVLVNNNLIVASCKGIVYNFDISNDTLTEVWQKQIPGGNCIESTPAVWNGQMFFGSRDGYIYSIK